MGWLVPGMEVVVLAALGTVAWRWLREGAARHLAGLATAVAACGLVLLLELALGSWWRGMVPNLLLRLLAGGGIGAVAWWGLARWRRTLPPRRSLEAWCRRAGFKGWVDRLLALGLLLGFAAMGLVLAAFAGRVLAFTGAGRVIAEHALFAGAWLPEEAGGGGVRPEGRPGEEAGREAGGVGEAMAAQRRLWRGLEGGVRDTTGLILEKTGTQGAARQLEALQRVIALPEDQKAALVAGEPAITALVDHPAVVAAVQSPAVQRLIDRAGEGSILAVYELGARPEIRALLEDPSVLETARRIDLVELLERHERRTRERAGAPAHAPP